MKNLTKHFLLLGLLCLTIILMIPTAITAQPDCPGGISSSQCELLESSMERYIGAESIEFLFVTQSTTQMSSFVDYELFILGTGYAELDNGEVLSLDLQIEEATISQAGFMGFGSTSSTYVGRLIYVDGQIFFGYGVGISPLDVPLTGMDLSDLAGSDNIDWTFYNAMPDLFMSQIPGSGNNWSFESDVTLDDGVEISIIENQIFDTNPVATSMASLGTLLGENPTEDAAYGTILGMFGAGMDIQGAASYFGQWWIEPEGDALIGWVSGQEVVIDMGNMFGNDPLFSMFISTAGGYSQSTGIRIHNYDVDYDITAPEEFAVMPAGTANTIGLYGINGMASMLTGLFYPLSFSAPATTTTQIQLDYVDGGVIDYGGSLDGELTSGEGINLDFEGNNGDIVTVSLTSDEFDAFVEIRDESGQRIASNDDGGDDTNALITNFVLPEDGNYTIVVRGFSSASEGAYTVELDLFERPEPGMMAYGDSVEGLLISGIYDEWTFEGEAGDLVTINLMGEFDTYLELNDPDGVRITYNDDGGQGRNSLINNFVLPEDGTYTIISRGYSSSAQGSYTIELTVTERTVPGELEYGSAVSGMLISGIEDEWTFSGNEGDVITITMNADFDTYLELLDFTDYQIAYNDDGGAGRNSLISQFTLPITATYTIVARGYRSNAQGDYTLELVIDRSGDDDNQTTTNDGGTTTNNGTTATPTNGEIAYGDTISGNLISGNEDQWVFSGTAGDIITISLTGTFDTYLELLDSNGNQITFNDDGGEGFNSLISFFALPQSGTYTIVARGFSSSASGSYSLALIADSVSTGGGSGGTSTSTSTDSTISYGDTITANLRSGVNDEWTFEGSGGDIITISLTASFDTYLELLDENGNQITYNDDGGQGLNSLIDNFRLPADGTYTIVARGYSSSASGSYSLALIGDDVATPQEDTDNEATTSGNSTSSGGNTSTSTDGTISYGDSVDANLASGNEDEWTFEGSGGDIITISLTASFDTYLELMDADGNQIAFNDDGGQGLNSLIDNFRLPADGTYTIVARGFSSSASGAYNLSLDAN